jgi:DNA-directed RNA polymerase subunit F
MEGGEVKTYKMNELFNSINNTLETQLKRQNEILRQMLDIMPRPTGKFRNILETAVLFASVFGILNLIDIIIKWVIGG